jgi:hypothetical protein
MTDADCITITAGTICTGSCLCGGATINRDGQARYDAAISGIMTGLCPCAASPPPRCLGGTCVVCTGGPGDPPECGISVHADAGVVCMQTGGGGGGSPDGGSCDLESTAKCSDGTTYDVKCSCPAATCFCSETFGQGGGGSSSGGTMFAGCAESCSPGTVALAYQACGFPIPQ